MKTLLVTASMLFGFTFASAQDEQARVVEKEFKYNDWTYKTVAKDSKMNLREFVKGKKLVMVVYFAAWCQNWKNEAPFAQKLYEKYKDQGFGVIGVSEYDTVDATKTDLGKKGITLPVVYESVSREAKQKTLHYEYRKAAGDTRNWGSPWNLFIEPKKITKDGDLLLKKAFVVNGELIEKNAENFVREKLGLKPLPAETAAKSDNTDSIKN